MSSYSCIQISIYSDKVSSILGVNICFTDNKSDLYPTPYYTFTYNSNETLIKKFDIHNKFFRISYKNLFLNLLLNY